MAVQKRKPKNRDRVKNPEKFNWTTQRRKAAQMISTGLYSQNQVAETLHVYPQTVSSWKQYPEFMQEVDKLTFLQENATRAGVVRRALKALNIKERNIDEDKSTYLDYLEFILKTIPPDVKGDDDKLKELADAIMNSAKIIGK